MCTVELPPGVHPVAVNKYIITVRVEIYLYSPLRAFTACSRGEISLSVSLMYVYIIVNSLLSPWSRVLLEKLTGLQLVKKFPAFYGTRRFITAFTIARHLSLS
jgi:hypothetical protein